MWIERPGLGTGVPKHPTLPPNGAAVLTDDKKAALLAACPPFLRAVKPGCPCGAAGAW